MKTPLFLTRVSAWLRMWFETPFLWWVIWKNNQDKKLTAVEAAVFQLNVISKRIRLGPEAFHRKTRRPFRVATLNKIQS